MSDITFRTRVTPIHTLVSVTESGTTNMFLPSDEAINLFAKQGFPEDFYHYQYSLDNSIWIDIAPEFYDRNKLSISAKKLLGNSFSQQVGKNIYIRVVSCFDNGIYQSVSAPVVLTVLQSAPHVGRFTVTPNLCAYGETGAAILNFNRALVLDESLEISLVNTITGAAIFNKDITNNLQTDSIYKIQDLPPGTYRLNMLGAYEGNASYTDGPQHTLTFEIQRPLPVTFDLASKTNVYCYQGNDGSINLTAAGGQSQYQYVVTKNGQPFLDWTDFANGNQTVIQNLDAATYKIRVRDINFCMAKDPNNSSLDKEITVLVSQPLRAIAMPTADIEISQPKGYGLSNGYISLAMIGGTPNVDGSYNFEWRKDTDEGTVITTGITTVVNQNSFTIKLDGITAGKYFLTVKDKNYINATSELGSCGIISVEFVVDQPDPLLASITAEKQISCNIVNNYPYKIDLDHNGVPDEAEDGSLKAIVKGGVGYYSYQWQQFNGGVFQDIAGATQQVLERRSIGVYRVLVRDINSNATDAEQTLIFPAELLVSLSANVISCHNQNNGVVSVMATGGTGTYAYQWNTMDAMASVNGLSAGNYFVLVNDAKGCKVKGSVEVVQPDQIIITDVLVKHPVCYEANNGEIRTVISGGKAPYHISWSNGISDMNNIGLLAGNYTLTVTDANGCSSVKHYTLVDPERLTIDLGSDLTLCLGDSQTYNVTVKDNGATYKWTNQNGNTIATTPTITLANPGTYTILITDSKGCMATDNVVIKNSSEVLSPQLMLPSHAYLEAEVVLVNTSAVKPEAVQWVVPNDVSIRITDQTDDYLKLKFSAVGAYQIGLKAIQGACVKTSYKTLIVEENNAGAQINPTKTTNINEFAIFPNPNNGDFKVSIKLEKEKTIKLKVLNMVSYQMMPAIIQPKSTSFVIPIQLNLPVGAYLLILETGDEAVVKRMIVN